MSTRPDMNQLVVDVYDAAAPGTKDRTHNCLEDLHTLRIKYGDNAFQIAISMVLDEMLRGVPR
jgi:hypothetical protein